MVKASQIPAKPLVFDRRNREAMLNITVITCRNELESTVLLPEIWSRMYIFMCVSIDANLAVEVYVTYHRVRRISKVRYSIV